MLRRSTRITPARMIASPLHSSSFTRRLTTSKSMYADRFTRRESRTFLLLTCQVRIGEPLTVALKQRQRKAVCIIQRVVFRGAVIEAENLLCNVAVKVEGFHCNIGATKATLQQTSRERPEAFFRPTAAAWEAHHFSLFLGSGFGFEIGLGARNNAVIVRSKRSRDAFPERYTLFILVFGLGDHCVRGGTFV
jgi:hypothetical protein